VLKRLPVILFVVGFAIKASLVAAWRLFQTPMVMKALTVADPIAFTVAEWLTSLFFNPRRIMPTAVESAAFDFFLVMVFALECLILGYVIRALVVQSRGSLHRGDANVRTSPPAL
jgi:hypothetical protein